jgi:enoyl-CoA hydratase
MTGERPVLVDRDGYVAVIHLNRTQRLNAVSLSLYLELTRALQDLADDASLRALILTGAGRAFCVGADLKAHGEGPLDPASRREYVDAAQEAARRLREFPVPTIAAVNGHAIGAGLELALSCDFVVVSETAKLRFPEVSLGTFVGGGVTFTLSRRVGLTRARELMLLCPMFSGEEAAEWELANRCVSGDRVLQEARELAIQLASMAPIPVRHAKRLLRSGWSAHPEEATAAEAEALIECMASADWLEGIRAFEEEREPRFRGE